MKSDIILGFVGDPHFGASYSIGTIDKNTQLNSRLLDFAKTFNDTIDKFVAHKVSHVVILGDVFDGKRPSSAQLNTFSKCLSNVVNHGMEVVIISGNHDQQRAISTTTVDMFNLLNLPSVYVYSDLAIHAIKDTNINLVLLPFKDRRMLGVLNNTHAVAKIKAQFDEITKDVTGKKIVCGHFMIDEIAPGVSSDHSMNEIVLPSNMFSDCDAVIMGHVHKHKVIRKKNPMVMYSGSMDKKSFGEKDYKNVSIVLDTNKPNEPKILPSAVRALKEAKFDYSNKEHFGKKIMAKITADLEQWSKKNDLGGAIVRVSLVVRDSDKHYINQKEIEEIVKNKNAGYVLTPRISSITSRKLRNKNITEVSDSTSAIIDFINTTKETDSFKKKMVEVAARIIKNVDCEEK